MCVCVYEMGIDKGTRACNTQNLDFVYTLFLNFYSLQIQMLRTLLTSITYAAPQS